MGSRIDTVAIVTEAIYEYEDLLLTSAHDAYSTPLGEVPIDPEAVNEITNLVKSNLGINFSPILNDNEHSTELTLPMLQRALIGKFTILPIMMRVNSLEVVSGLGEALGKVLSRKKALLVVSSCLSHFYTEKVAIELDKTILEAIKSFIPERVLQTEKQGHNYRSGVGPIATVMYTSRLLGAKKSIIVGYSHSGNVTGDKASVVGYGSAIFTLNLTSV